MMGKTHRAAGGLLALGGYMALKRYGMLDPGISDVSELVVIYAASYYGAVFPDNDHVWESSPLKDPLSWIINKVLHLTTPVRRKMEMHNANKGVLYNLLGLFDARHRSWQTHSEIPLILLLIVLLSIPRGLEWTMFLGFFMGYVSHAVMDMLSVGGWNVVSFKVVNKILRRKVLPEKIRLVPKTKFFVTDGKFESGVYWVLSVVTVVLAVWVVALEGVSVYSRII